MSKPIGSTPNKSDINLNAIKFTENSMKENSDFKFEPVKTKIINK